MCPTGLECPVPSNMSHMLRAGSGDTIVDAMLETATASKLRATAVIENEERFSISKCVEVVDKMQHVDHHLSFFTLDLFENPNARETFISLKSERRFTWLQNKFNSSSSVAV
ncbi:hypothetical protein POM88_012189 [Heracleum sosnowskyi]|uniref:Uncharacterized protein n=1 Tax=Heracleum sosnowskyi TaxID=360622 RepID=A0AAD8IY83_9APIA|nr:hypothetical protein POM88_012189 [Heracleum sosnowskyi]